MIKVLYLHGLGSNGQSSTAQALSDLGYEVVSPTYKPELENESSTFLGEVIKSSAFDLIIGTSLGGYYALKFAERLEIPVIAINPAFDPQNLLRKYLDNPAMNWKTGEQIEITRDMLSDFSIPKPSGEVLVVTGVEDDVIDPVEQIHYCNDQGILNIKVDWGHRVSDVNELKGILDRFYKKIQLPKSESGEQLKHQFCEAFGKAFTLEQLKFIEEYFDLTGKEMFVIDYAYGSFKDGLAFEIHTDSTPGGSIQIENMSSGEFEATDKDDYIISVEKMFEMIGTSRVP